MTLLDQPISATAAEQRAAANLSANRSALCKTQPNLGQSLMPPRQSVEWLFARDGFLSAREENGRWLADCSVPFDAALAMFRKMDVTAPVTCFLIPPHAANVRIALDKLSADQAVIAVLQTENELRMMLACDNFSADLLAHRLWFAVGETWTANLETLLIDQAGLAIPSQFLRLHCSDESLISDLIGKATVVFTKVTNGRAQRFAELRQTAPTAKRMCVISPSRFQLWNDEGAILGKLAPADSVLLDTSDPSLSSPLLLAETVCDCGILVAPNFARADLPELIPSNVPWITWVTAARVPSFTAAGPRDRLLVAAASIRRAALAAGWPDDRIHLAGWPNAAPPSTTATRELTILADTVVLKTPGDLEGFSSHRLLWETIHRELLANPFSMVDDPLTYLKDRLSRFDVSAESFPHERFITNLIVPAHQQSIARTLIGGGLPLRAFGRGWDQIDDFAPHANGEIASADDFQNAIASSTTLVNLWPWRTAHPIESLGRPVISPNRSEQELLESARKSFAAPSAIASASIAPLTTDLLQSFLPAI